MRRPQPVKLIYSSILSNPVIELCFLLTGYVLLLSIILYVSIYKDRKVAYKTLWQQVKTILCYQGTLIFKLYLLLIFLLINFLI